MYTVLIVEDEKLIRQGIKTMVQRSGVPIEVIIECNNGEMALEVLESRKVDIMFTDIRMPRMDGIALVNAMQRLPNKPLTVAVSGYDDFSYAVEMLRNGVREYLLKPVERDKIREILGRFHAELENAKKSEDAFLDMGCQQIKYLIMNRNISKEEQKTIIERFEDHLPGYGYVVCCAENTKGNSKVGEHTIYLSDMGCQELYICEADYKEEFLEEKMQNRYVGVSKTHQGMYALRQAYEEAFAARKQAFCTCMPVKEFEKEAPGKVSRAGEMMDSNLASHVVQLLGTVKVEEALRLLEYVFRNVKKGHFTPGDLEDCISRFLGEMEAAYKSVPEAKELSVFRKIYDVPCLEDWEEGLFGWILRFHEHIHARFDKDNNMQKLKESVSFIQENYNKDLNMAVVSNHISMNYSLFSYMFKQYTGSNFVNYIKELRMKEAKRLLEETPLRIGEISQKTGYENEKHFMKIFKSTYGVSPTEYRKNMRFMKEI